MNKNSTESTAMSTPSLSSTAPSIKDDLSMLAADTDVITKTETMFHVPQGCNKTMSDFVPWDNPKNVMSIETLKVLEIVVYCGLMPLLCAIGLFTNPCNCAVFYRLGVKKGINLCLLLLSISDTLYIVTKTTLKSSKVLLFLLYGSQGVSHWDLTVVTYHLLRKVLDPSVKLGIGRADVSVQAWLYMLRVVNPVPTHQDLKLCPGYRSHLEVFLFFSNFLTTLASVERCVSIISPLKARIAFSRCKMVIIIVAVFIVDLATFLVIGFKHKTSCVISVHDNTAVWAITASKFFMENQVTFYLLDNLFLIFGFPLLSVTVMIVSTSLILYHLRLAARWRQNTSSSGRTKAVYNGAGVSKSETQLYKMLVAVACVHVACTVPTITRDMIRSFLPAFSINGHYSNLFNAVIAIKDAMASINCTVNFFIYYGLSAQFRHTLAACLCARRPGKTDTVSTVSKIPSVHCL